jgi:hypothetical protein
MVIEFEDALDSRVRALAADAGYDDPAKYVVAVMAAEAESATAWGAAEFPAGPPHLEIRSKADLERLLLSRIDAGPMIEATPQFWADLQKQMEARRTPGEPANERVGR